MNTMTITVKKSLNKHISEELYANFKEKVVEFSDLPLELQTTEKLIELEKWLKENNFIYETKDHTIGE